MSIKDNPYFKIVPAVPFVPHAPAADEILHGDFWSLHLRDGAYYLEYVSGELAGRAKSLQVTKADFESIRDGVLTIDHVLAQYHAN
jgi:hypothetical protein